MDRQSTIGFILIFVVLMVWMFYNTPPPPVPPPPGADTAEVAAPAQPDTPKMDERGSAQTPVPAESEIATGRFFAGRDDGAEKIIIIETDLYTAEVTSRGGLLRKWEMKKYKTWSQHPVHLVDMEKGGDFSLLFLSKDGKQINTRTLYFDAPYRAWEKITLTGEETHTVELVLPAGDEGKIVKRFTFTNGAYTFKADVEMVNLANVISGFEYQVLWETPLPYAEHNSVDESHYAMAYAFSGGEVAEVDATSQGETVKRDLNGVTDWVAARNKYFAVALIPDGTQSQGAYLEGRRSAQQDRGEKELYSVALKMPFKGEPRETASFKVFLGPLDFSLVKSLDTGLERIMSLGWWIIRPITQYLLLPLLQFLHLFIANWGVVIIVFSIIIKIVLYPLTKTQMESARKMGKLAPMMTELREKHANDPQKMNTEMMRLYRDYGINPAGGCLPLLLQMPILYALYNVFSSTIQLRQSAFFGWIHDLSVPDAIVTLPFTLPLFGTNHLSGLAIAMAATMFIQQKLTITDPRQKALMYMMPVMLLFIFNALPSGLNLYYFVFNLLSIGHQMYVNKQHADEPLRKVDPKKAEKGILGKLAKNLPDINKR